MTPGIEVRAYAAADEAEVIALWESCGLTRPWNDPRRDIARKQTVQRELFVVGTLGGAPGSPIVASAMAGYDGHRGWINYLAVSPAHRRQGIGEGLMRHVEQALESMGCPKLNLQVRATNTDVLAFYRRLGYQQDDVVSFGKRLISDTP